MNDDLRGCGCNNEMHECNCGRNDNCCSSKLLFFILIFILLFIDR